VAIVAARMATQTPHITVADGVQKMNVEVKEHGYSLELTFSNGIFTMSVDKSDCIKSKEPGKSWIIEKYEKALVDMNQCAKQASSVKERQMVAATLATVDAINYKVAPGDEKMTVLVKEFLFSLVLAFFPEVLSGGPNHVNTMLMFECECFLLLPVVSAGSPLNPNWRELKWLTQSYVFASFSNQKSQ
jgi:hypothetical protein